MKALILVGGKGSRLGKLTKTYPKPLLPINGKPLLSYVLENLRENGVTDITLSVGYKSDIVRKVYGDGYSLGVKLSYKEESEPLGTGGAIKSAFGKAKEPFILVFGDNLANFNFRSMITIHKPGTVLMALTDRKDVEHFGVVKMYGMLVQDFIEKPKREEAPSNLINAGAFIIDPSVLKMLPKGTSSLEHDLLEKICLHNKLYGTRHTGYWFPTDTPEKLKYTNKRAKEYYIY